MRRSMLISALAAAFIAAPALAAPGHATSLAPVYAASQGWLNGTLTPADTAGKLRATVVGDSQDDAVEKIVQKLLAAK
jgi:hypothetical protein